MLCAGLYREFAMFALIQRCRCLLPAMIAVFGLFFGFTAAAVTPTTVVSGLRHPWAVAFLPDRGFLVSERGGALRVVQADGRIGPPLQGVPPQGKTVTGVSAASRAIRRASGRQPPSQQSV